MTKREIPNSSETPEMRARAVVDRLLSALRTLVALDDDALLHKRAAPAEQWHAAMDAARAAIASVKIRDLEAEVTQKQDKG